MMYLDYVTKLITAYIVINTSEACNHYRLDILKYLHNLSIRCDNVHYITVASKKIIYNALNCNRKNVYI